MEKGLEESLVSRESDPYIRFLNKIVLLTVKALAFLIVIILLWGIVDVIVHIYDTAITEPAGRYDTEELLETLGSFLAVLIIVEVFLNIVFYLKKDVVHVPLVLATGLTAVARKIIILDYIGTDPMTLFGIAAIIFASGLVYWLVAVKEAK